ncbi:hypothetical protein [Nocardioides sp. Root151]|uniref:hypothetical protein n=1 Tax=Nocardioides sp. Root151 TaxID=1736475 RepID=UPI0007033ACE|nr:hypothetical protein [Nocardioides sp. Root151]KQZ66868.1 hypothetical protein ASD66_17760 [Nocardioides sp. Root151]
MRLALAVLMIVLPQRLKHLLARHVLKWDVDPTAYIGRSLVMVRKVTLGPGSSIGPMNIIRDLEELRLGEGASIATRNRIAGIPLASTVFQKPNRNPSLVLGDYAMITVAHELDCSDLIELKEYAVVAGFRCSILTHNLNLVKDRFESKPVVLGARSVVMSNCTLLSSSVPDRSIISAGSVVTTPLTTNLTLYRGNPAEAVRSLPESLKFFHRVGLQAQIADEVAALKKETLQGEV